MKLRPRGRMVWFALLLSAACRTAPQGLRAADAPSDVLGRFLDAAQSGDFEEAYQWLAGSWRARYTPARLKEDFEREPLGPDRIARARAAMKAAPLIHGDSAEFPIGEGKAVRLVREVGGFRVAALE